MSLNLSIEIENPEHDPSTFWGGIEVADERTDSDDGQSAAIVAHFFWQKRK